MKEIEKKVVNSIDQDLAVRTTQELIRIPAWQDYDKSASEWEWERTEYLREKMVEFGFDVVPYREVGEVSYRRPVLIGFLRGKERGQPALFWTAHVDTHAPIDKRLQPRPFDGHIENEEVRGVGAADQLAAVGALFGALDAIKKLKVQMKRDLMLIFTPDEMAAARGAEVAEHWMKTNNVIPEFGISAECTDNQIGIAHTGINEFLIEITGETGHPSFKAKSVNLPLHNPVTRMFEVGKLLSEIEEKEEVFKVEHPVLGSPPYTWIGPIEGGTWVHSICWSGSPCDPLHDGITSYEAFGHDIRCGHMQPEYCRLIFGFRSIPRRLKPGEAFHTEPMKGNSNKEVLEMIERNLKELWEKSPSATTYTVSRTRDNSIPYEISPDEPHVKFLAEIMQELNGHKPRFVGPKHWTEVGRLTQQIGTPFVQIAPTWVRYHQPDEGVPIADIVQSAKIYAAAIMGFCGIVK